MSLTDLANFLINRLPEAGTGTIILNEAALSTSEGSNVTDVLADINAYLAIPEGSYLEITNLSRSDITVPAEGDPLVITIGSTSFLHVDMTVKNLNFYLEGTTTKTLQVALQTVEFPTDWTLGTSFPSLITFPALDGHLTNNSYIFLSGADNKTDWPVTSTVTKTIARGLNYYGELGLNISPLSQANNFLRFIKAESIPTTIGIFGTIDLKNPLEGFTLTFPTMTLISDPIGSGGPFKPFSVVNYDQLTLNSPVIGVRTLEVEVEEREGKYQDVTTELRFAVELHVTESIALDFSATLIEDAQFLMFGAYVTDDGKDISLDDIKNLMLDESWDEHIPAVLSDALQTIQFQGFSMTAFFDGLSEFTISTISVYVGSDPSKPIRLLQELPGFTDRGDDFIFNVHWTMISPTDTTYRQSMLSFSTTVTMTVDDKPQEIEVEIAGY
ncbi:MAG: hypothetical protein Q3M30_16280 [Candidatus Electrothrix sp. Rat3]|nr:hypothetical protein [Candidatus Electrothrix rattekaaiensis]